MNDVDEKEPIRAIYCDKFHEKAQHLFKIRRIVEIGYVIMI